MNVYDLSRIFWDYAFENPEKIKPNHIAMYFFAIEHCNRLGWKEKFGFPTTMVMDAISIKSYNTYIKTLNELVEAGFITMIEKSKNQYSANIIALSKNDRANDKALDKALIKHVTKQVESTIETNRESTVQSIDSIDKPIYNNTSLPINNILLEKESKEILENFDSEIPKEEISKTPEAQKEKSSAKKEKEVIELFHIKCSRLPKVQIINQSRKKFINARLKDFGIEKVKEVFEMVGESNFLNGENKQTWSADFDWIMKPANFAKILEGNYKNKQSGNNQNANNGNNSSGKNGGKVDGTTEILSGNVRYFEST